MIRGRDARELEPEAESKIKRATLLRTEQKPQDDAQKRQQQNQHDL